MTKLLTVTIGISFFMILFSILPFSVSIPGEVLSFFTGNSVKDFFNSLAYFLPIQYLFSCIVIVYSARYFKIFIKLIKWIYDLIF